MGLKDILLASIVLVIVIIVITALCYIYTIMIAKENDISIWKLDKLCDIFICCITTLVVLLVINCIFN